MPSTTILPIPRRPPANQRDRRPGINKPISTSRSTQRPPARCHWHAAAATSSVVVRACAGNIPLRPPCLGAWRAGSVDDGEGRAMMGAGGRQGALPSPHSATPARSPPCPQSQNAPCSSWSATGPNRCAGCQRLGQAGGLTLDVRYLLYPHIPTQLPSHRMPSSKCKMTPSRPPPAPQPAYAPASSI